MKRQQVVATPFNTPRRVQVLSSLLAFGFFILLARLWYLQIISGATLLALSENNRLRFVPVASSRGAILDRNGELLVLNSPSFSVAVIPQDVTDRGQLLEHLARQLGLQQTELDEKWDKGKGRAKYYPIVLASGISRDQVEFFEENRLLLPGVTVEMKPVRRYAYGDLASHLLGYIGEISEDELQKADFSNYYPGDYVGKSGIERNWESTLHGTDGGRQMEVDARGRYLRTVSETSPTVGNSIVLTIDHRIQKAAESAFGSQAGAAVLMDVRTGEILAFASNPDFDPALFAGRMPPDKWKQYMEDERHPLENKALKGQYPPGSTFKIVTALAGLEEGLIDPGTTVFCNGTYKMGKDTFRCWSKSGHGAVNLHKALRESCDVYFYHLGERLGVDRIADYGRKFALGAPLGIGLENEKGGNIPTTAWKEKRFGKKWLRGETPPVSIGQGYVLMTPIQLASMTATLANGGDVYRPRLVKRIVDADGKVLQEFQPQLLMRSDISSRSMQLVRDGLLAVVNESGGTGGAARIGGVRVAGKTGTAQVVKQRGTGAVAYRYRDHALFVAFAPYDKPEVAVAVVVEHGGHGGSAAGPIAGRILRSYFETTGVIRRPVQQDTVEGEETDDDVQPPSASTAGTTGGEE